MKTQEAIDLVKECGLNIEGIKNTECESLVISALEKQIPKKPIKINEYLTISGQWEDEWECATCGNPYIDNSYCGCCGQALDWSDTE